MASDPDPIEYASIRSAQQDCIALGHPWIEEPGHENGTKCLVCQTIRFD